MAVKHEMYRSRMIAIAAVRFVAELDSQLAYTTVLLEIIKSVESSFRLNMLRRALTTCTKYGLLTGCVSQSVGQRQCTVYAITGAGEDLLARHPETVPQFPDVAAELIKLYGVGSPRSEVRIQIVDIDSMRDIFAYQLLVPEGRCVGILVNGVLLDYRIDHEGIWKLFA